MSILFGGSVDMGYYSDRGIKENAIPRGFAPRDHIVFIPLVWIISHMHLAASQYCHIIPAQRAGIMNAERE